MTRFFASTLILIGALLGATPLNAGTIIKLSLSTDSMPDLELIDGTLSTVADAVGATLGDQNTGVRFSGVLENATVIEGDNASFTLSDIVLTGAPQVVAGTVIQTTQGGTFALYDPSNVLMLSGTLGNGTLSGPLGGAATGGFLTTEFGVFTDGYLLSTLQEKNVQRSSVSINLTDVNEGLGMSLLDGGELGDFTADGAANIGATGPQIPEPQAALLLLSGGLALVARRRARQSA